MKMYFKQRVFSWFDSYDIYAEDSSVLYTVKGQLSWGHCLKIFDSMGNEVGTVQERIFTFLPKFEMYIGENYLGCIKKEFSFFKPVFSVDCKGWSVEGNFFEWDYTVTDSLGNPVASVMKEIMRLSDRYFIEVFDPQNALYVLMLVLAIDAEKCSRNNG